ncbi:MAG: cell envelope integrity EipB family protein, partial [Hyphomicrobiales bacterium]|nr:cell envelope integrity EipB family protein [Hyphomicrobiales bacterium]
AIVLQPHRIAYEVSLGPRRGPGGFSGARGLIALEFTGNACDGYATNFRQATELEDADGQPRRLDFSVNLWEEGRGQRFRFTVLNKVNGQTTRDGDGEARRSADGSIAVAMKRPPGRKGDFDGAVLFPSAMMIGLIEAAQRGERRYDARLFDGSEGGEKIYETSATIGARLEGARNERLEPAMRVAALESVPRWPVVTAYYESTPGDRVPVYTMRAVTFANGVVSDLVFDFPDFSLVAKAVRYEALPVESCRR